MFRISCLCVISIIILWWCKERYTTSFYRKARIKTLHSIPRNNFIMTYNVQRMPFHIKSFYKLQRLVRKYSIVLLQECYCNIFYDEIHHHFPDFYIAKGVMINYRLVHSGLVILSRYPILSHTFVPYEDKELLSADILAEKGFLVVELSFHGKKIIIINTHLQSNVLEHNYTIALRQLHQLLTYVKQLTVPFLIGGDFNFSYNVFPSSTSYTLYRSASPTIYIQYDKEGHEMNTSSIWKPHYKPFIFDFFITHNILLSSTHTIPTDYSDHVPVVSTISHIL